MKAEPMDVLPLWAIFLIASFIVLGALEVGYQLGLWRHVHVADEKDAPVGAMVGSILGLLAFMLAFTFSMAASRHEDRRHVVLQEANAIGTTYLRTRLLPEPQRSEIARLLREYVELRISVAQPDVTNEIVEHAIARSEELHQLMWSKTMAVADKSPTVMTGLFVQTLNEMIDLHAKRILVGVRSRIPWIIWVGLLGLAILGMASSGYQAGLAATRRSPAMLGLTLAFASIFVLIADLDRSWEGSLRTNQGAMIDLQRSMKPLPP